MDIYRSLPRRNQLSSLCIMAAIMACSIASAALVFFFFFVAGDDAAIVEHTFVVSQVPMKHMCKDILVTVVNGQLPGPTIEVQEGDSVAVHVINNSPYQLTIHWHGLKQRLNCWADGAGMITQCPIHPNKNFTYRFDVTDHEGTLWWHSHVASLRATIHGAFIIRPRSGAKSYPFPKPHKEIPIVIGEWWEVDLVQLDKNFRRGIFGDDPVATTINGQLGDLNNCSGVVEDNYILDVEQGETYLLRIINAALFSEYFLKIAGHRFTVVAADANYVKPYTTDIIVIAPGETVDALVVADAPPGRYYMVALADQPTEPEQQTAVFISRGVVQYKLSKGEYPSDSPIMVPEMPDQHDTIISFYFHGNLTNFPHSRRPPVPINIDERLFITLGLGSICQGDHALSSSSSSPPSSCNKSVGDESFIVSTMNNISFELPTKMPLLEAHYHGNISNAGMLEVLPDRPPRMFNFTDQVLILPGQAEAPLEATSRATVTRRFRYNTSVEIVFQSTALLQSESNPMHLHGHDFFVLAQGIGNYDAERGRKMYNLVNPPMKNTILVPRLGWAAIRFVTDNPGVWYLHCHFEFHVSMGMAAAFEVEDGPTLDTTLPAPPVDLPRCDHNVNDVAYQ